MVSTEHQQAEGRNTRNASKILASVAVLAVAGGMFMVASLALFSDQETAAGNAFSTGSIDLVATPASAIITAADMAPGDQVTASLDVANSGSLEFRYAASSTTTEDVLASQLVLTIKTGVTVCDDANWTTDGASIYSSELGDSGSIALFGNPTQGAQLGDRVLAAGGNEALCFNVTLPLSASNASQGLSSTATFTFDAEQTANNP